MCKQIIGFSLLFIFNSLTFVSAEIGMPLEEVNVISDCETLSCYMDSGLYEKQKLFLKLFKKALSRQVMPAGCPSINYIKESKEDNLLELNIGRMLKENYSISLEEIKSDYLENNKKKKD